MTSFGLQDLHDAGERVLVNLLASGANPCFFLVRVSQTLLCACSWEENKNKWS